MTINTVMQEDLRRDFLFGMYPGLSQGAYRAAYFRN